MTPNEMPRITKSGLLSLADAALDAFWRVVASRFPEATSGDLSPLTTVRLSTVAEKAVKEWISVNVPSIGPGNHTSGSGEPTNADRAAWAKQALDVFTMRTFGGACPHDMHRDDLECAVGDLIADLLHYAQQRGYDTGVILYRACGHFAAELLDETCQPKPSTNND